MKNKIKIGFVSLAVFCATACTSDFGSINTDPNNPTSVTPDLLLTPLLHTLTQRQFNYGDGKPGWRIMFRARTTTKRTSMRLVRMKAHGQTIIFS